MTLFFYNLFNALREDYRRWRTRRLLSAYNRIANRSDHWNGIVLSGGWDEFKRPYMVVAGQRRYVPDWLVKEVHQGDRLMFRGGTFLLKKY